MGREGGSWHAVTPPDGGADSPAIGGDGRHAAPRQPAHPGLLRRDGGAACDHRPPWRGKTDRGGGHAAKLTTAIRSAACSAPRG